MDYYSRFFEVAPFDSTTIENAIRRSIFSSLVIKSDTPGEWIHLCRTTHWKENTLYPSNVTRQANSQTAEVETQETERKYTLQQTENHNKHHRASVLPDLNIGDKVWILDTKTPAVIVRRSQEPHSFIIKTENSLLIKNRRDLVSSPRANVEGTSNTQLEGISLTHKNPKTSNLASPQSTVIKTCSSRIVNLPTQLDLSNFQTLMDRHCVFCFFYFR